MLITANDKLLDCYSSFFQNFNQIFADYHYRYLLQQNDGGGMGQLSVSEIIKKGQEIAAAAAAAAAAS